MPSQSIYVYYVLYDAYSNDVTCIRKVTDCA
jgi:hypothetical protein